MILLLVLCARLPAAAARGLARRLPLAPRAAAGRQRRRVRRRQQVTRQSAPRRGRHARA